jgi:tetratricopeptide (TPR) repeat protein
MTGGGRRSSKKAAAALQGWLLEQSKEKLVVLLMEQAERDVRLWERLAMEKAAQGPGGFDAGPFLAAVEGAIDTGGFIEYAEAYSYATGIGEVLDGVEKLLGQGHASAVIEIAEHAYRGVEEAMGEVDDSDGYLGGVLERIEELHLAACRDARPDAEHLAQKVFDLERTSEYGFDGALARYRSLLGPAGVEAYLRLAEEAWAKVPPLGPGDGVGRADRYRITRIMETLAGLSGDLEAQVAVETRDLSGSRQFLKIAELYRAAGRPDDALAWAERGVAAFPDDHDGSLVGFVIDEYQDRGRHADAMELAWGDFTRNPGSHSYCTLKDRAQRAGQWSTWRTKALAELRTQAPDPGRSGPRWAPVGRSEVVRALLWDDDPDAAWKDAVAGGCSDELWLELAAKREADHPRDVLSVYRGVAERRIAQKDNAAYRQAVEVLGRLRAVTERLGEEREFGTYIAALRAAHRPKRNLMAALAAAGW